MWWVEALVAEPACQLPSHHGTKVPKCCLFLGPLYPTSTLNWGSNFPFKDMDILADLEFSLGPALCLGETADALKGPFQL